MFWKLRDEFIDIVNRSLNTRWFNKDVFSLYFIHIFSFILYHSSMLESKNPKRERVSRNLCLVQRKSVNGITARVSPTNDGKLSSGTSFRTFTKQYMKPPVFTKYCYYSLLFIVDIMIYRLTKLLRDILIVYHCIRLLLVGITWVYTSNGFKNPWRELYTRMCCLCLTNVDHRKFAFSRTHFVILLALILE